MGCVCCNGDELELWLRGECCWRPLCAGCLPHMHSHTQHIDPGLLQNWEDEDMKGLLEEISKGLADNIQLLSSWDKYRKEVHLPLQHVPARSWQGCRSL